MAVSAQYRFMRPTKRNQFPKGTALNKETFCNAVNEYRIKEKVSVEDLSNILNLHQSTVYNYLRGLAAPTYDLLKKFADLMSVSVETLGLEKVFFEDKIKEFDFSAVKADFAPTKRNVAPIKKAELNVNIKLDIEVPLSCAVQLRKVLNNFNITELN